MGGRRRPFKIVLPELDRFSPLPPGWGDYEVRLFEENKGLISSCLGKLINAKHKISYEDLETVNSEMNRCYFRLVGGYDPGRGEFSTYVYKSLIGVFKNQLRGIHGRATAKTKKPEIVSLDGCPDSEIADSSRGRNLFRDQEVLVILREALLCLNSRDREVVFRYYILGDKQGEIARKLNMSGSGVSLVLKKSLPKMKKLLISQDISIDSVD